MSKILYCFAVVSGFALLGCNHDTDRPTTPATPEMGAGTDPDARAAGDVQSEYADKNYGTDVGGSASRAGTPPEIVGGTASMTSGGVGRSDNDGTPNGQSP
jgi:hypothetical protein